jgi:hypothetical protein
MAAMTLTPRQLARLPQENLRLTPSSTAAAPILTELREDFDLSLAPLKAGQKRVDREKKILYGVLMLGRKSGNTHGVAGVDGTDYDPQAIRAALPLYEGALGYADSAPRPMPGQPIQDRSIYDALGVHHGIREAAVGIVSDFHLVPHHKLTESILDAAENDNLSGLFVFSHDADGQGEVRGRRYVVTKITKALGGNVVARSESTGTSTTKTFWESPEPTAANPKEPTNVNIPTRESVSLSLTVLKACDTPATRSLLEALNQFPTIEGKMTCLAAIKQVRGTAPASAGTRPTQGNQLRESASPNYDTLYGARLTGAQQLQEAGGPDYESLYGAPLR